MVIASAVLSLFNSSWIELSDEKDNVKFCANTIGSISSWEKKDLGFLAHCTHYSKSKKMKNKKFLAMNKSEDTKNLR
jgi:hypothetical protein